MLGDPVWVGPEQVTYLESPIGARLARRQGPTLSLG